MTTEEIQRGLMSVIDCVAHDSLTVVQNHATVRVARRHIRFLCDLIDDSEKRGVDPLTKRTITVILRDGHCVGVQNRPGAWMYDVQDEHFRSLSTHSTD